MNPEDLSRLRQGVYRLLGAGLSRPTADLLETAVAAPALLDEMGLFDFSYAGDLIEACEALGEADLEGLSISYATMFETGVAGAAGPPHESAFRADARTGQVAEVVAELKRTVLRFGLQLEEAHGDMVDHIGTELEIMAALCRREGERRSQDRSVDRVLAQQWEFLEDHLLAWAPAYAQRVTESEGDAAYISVASALVAFLADERQLVPLLLATEESVR